MATAASRYDDGDDLAELKQTHENLSMLLTDDSAFESVLNAVFESMDVNRQARRRLHLAASSLSVLTDCHIYCG